MRPGSGAATELELRTDGTMDGLLPVTEAEARAADVSASASATAFGAALSEIYAAFLPDAAFAGVCGRKTGD